MRSPSSKPFAARYGSGRSANAGLAGRCAVRDRVVGWRAIDEFRLQPIFSHGFNKGGGVTDNAKMYRQKMASVLRKGGIQRRFFDIEAVVP